MTFCPLPKVFSGGESEDIQIHSPAMGLIFPMNLGYRVAGTG